MNQQAEAYLKRVCAEQAEKAKAQAEKAKAEQAAQKEAILLALGLTEETGERKKEYAPSSWLAFEAEQNGYTEFDEIDGKKRYYRYADPAKAISMSDEEFAAFCAKLPPEVLAKAKGETAGNKSAAPAPVATAPAQKEYALDIEPKLGRSGAAMFFRILAIIVWAGGLLVSIFNSNNIVMDGRSLEEEFSFTLFLTNIIYYGLYGSILFAVSIVINEVHETLSSVLGLTLKRK